MKLIILGSMLAVLYAALFGGKGLGSKRPEPPESSVEEIDTTSPEDPDPKCIPSNADCDDPEGEPNDDGANEKPLPAGDRR